MPKVIAVEPALPKFTERVSLRQTPQGIPGPHHYRMNAFIVAFLVANGFNIALHGLFFFQLGAYSGTLARSDPLGVRTLVTLFSWLEVFHSVTMAWAGGTAFAGFAQSRTFLLLFSTIRCWNVPISVAVYGFYAFQILSLTGSWKIPGVILSLVLAQIAGSITWTVGTVTATLPVDMRARNGMTMAGTLLCTIGASLCSICVLTSLIVIIRDNLLWRSRERRGLLVDLQVISMRVHIPVMLVTATDLVGYLFFPKSHISMVMAIIIGKIWSNTLVHGLNSRRGLRATWNDPPIVSGPDTIQSVPRRWRRNGPVRDNDLGMELADMGRSSDGSVISSVVFEQDISTVQITQEDEAKPIGEVERHQPIHVLFGEQPPNNERDGERYGRRSSAPV